MQTPESILSGSDDLPFHRAKLCDFSIALTKIRYMCVLLPAVGLLVHHALLRGAPPFASAFARIFAKASVAFRNVGSTRNDIIRG